MALPKIRGRSFDASVFEAPERVAAALSGVLDHLRQAQCRRDEPSAREMGRHAACAMACGYGEAMAGLPRCLPKTGAAPSASTVCSPPAPPWAC